MGEIVQCLHCLINSVCLSTFNGVPIWWCHLCLALFAQLRFLTWERNVLKAAKPFERKEAFILLDHVLVY